MTTIQWGQPVPIGQGDGVTTQWQITDAGGFAIPLPSGASVSVGGAITSQFSVSASGMLTFSSAPSPGAAIIMQPPPGGYADRAWFPQQASRSVKPAVWQAKFGDGYEQNTPQGINYQPETWTLTFSFITQADAQEFEQMLAGYGGYQAFTWRSPRGPNPLRVLCRSWSDVNDPGKKFALQAKFEQVYGQ